MQDKILHLTVNNPEPLISKRVGQTLLERMQEAAGPRHAPTVMLRERHTGSYIDYTPKNPLAHAVCALIGHTILQPKHLPLIEGIGFRVECHMDGPYENPKKN